MEAHRSVVEVPVGSPGDPVGHRLERFLQAREALEHAVARRNFLAHAIALLGIPVWLLGVGIGPSVVREIALVLFPVLAVGFLASAIAERWWSLRLHRIEHELAGRRPPQIGG